MTKDRQDDSTKAGDLTAGTLIMDDWSVAEVIRSDSETTVFRGDEDALYRIKTDEVLRWLKTGKAEIQRQGA